MQITPTIRTDTGFAPELLDLSFAMHPIQFRAGRITDQPLLIGTIFFTKQEGKLRLFAGDDPKEAETTAARRGGLQWSLRVE